MMMIRSLILLLCLAPVAPTSLSGNPLASFAAKDLQIRQYDAEAMPSLFGPEEAEYDRYAACLAATEGLRRLRDKKLGGRLRVRGEPTEAQKRATAEYVMNSSIILETMGMSVSQFNQLGRQVGDSAQLKEKVMEQAYLYRMAATLDMDRIPLVDAPASAKLLKATRRQRVEMFCESMQEIEQLRADQMAKLKRSLHVQQLPPGISLSDPGVMPFLSPKVRAVVEAFPLQAEQIVKRHGLNSDEFNKMLDQAKGNPLFRYRVDKYMKEGEEDKVDEL
eukprot:CAMPEP_0119013210 /NCGR_PEP_ID=MMETSP1176-20130426/8152_1 /TAXON_ID=265551 /ORGANISM="Synedropsis recta cf, Strain CCMP1620" /LENGTH=276 /DNA_ID=CAMNT_0006966275 /DNA_START=28 /DNA_END=858 /DNA_ORIENTATION=+